MIKLDPTSAETYTDIGTALLERKELRSSLLEYERALRLEPANELVSATTPPPPSLNVHARPPVRALSPVPADGLGWQ